MRQCGGKYARILSGTTSGVGLGRGRMGLLMGYRIDKAATGGRGWGGVGRVLRRGGAWW